MGPTHAGPHTCRMRLGVRTIPEVADCHQRANETSDQMACSLKCAWMIEKIGGKHKRKSMKRF